jgi:hypothetical protein
MPSTSELLLIADRARPRTQQREIGPSDLGTCRKRVGFKLAGTEPVNEAGSVVAMVGTAVHIAVAEAMHTVAAPGDLVEHPVTFAGITGTLDRYEAATRTVVDTKTTSRRMLEHHQLHGPPRPHIWQLSFYGAGLIEQGHEVERIRLEYLVRDTGEEWPHQQPFRTSDVRDALMWLKTVRDTELAMLPRDFDPDSAFCRGCPFGGMDGGICWEGHIPGRDFRSVLYVENPDASMWAQQLWEARQHKTADAKIEAEARGALTAIVDPGGRITRCGDFALRIDARGAMKFVALPVDDTDYGAAS